MRGGVRSARRTRTCRRSQPETGVTGRGASHRARHASSVAHGWRLRLARSASEGSASHHSSAFADARSSVRPAPSRPAARDADAPVTVDESRHAAAAAPAAAAAAAAAIAAEPCSSSSTVQQQRQRQRAALTDPARLHVRGRARQRVRRVAWAALSARSSPRSRPAARRVAAPGVCMPCIRSILHGPHRARMRCILRRSAPARPPTTSARGGAHARCGRRSRRTPQRRASAWRRHEGPCAAVRSGAGVLVDRMRAPSLMRRTCAHWCRRRPRWWRNPQPPPPSVHRRAQRARSACSSTEHAHGHRVARWGAREATRRAARWRMRGTQIDWQSARSNTRARRAHELHARDAHPHALPPTRTR